MRKKSTEEEPKATVAKRVITPKSLYFVPSVNKSFEADSLEDAVKQAELEQKREDGDA